MDTGVNTQHPEFKYYDPEGFSGSGLWNSRVIKTDWRDYCPEITNNLGLGGTNFLSAVSTSKTGK